MTDLAKSARKPPFLVQSFIPDTVRYVATTQAIPAGQAPRGQYYQIDRYRDACWYTKNHYVDPGLKEGSATISITTKLGELSDRVMLDHLVFRIKRAEESRYYAAISYGLKLYTYAQDSKRIATRDISENTPNRYQIRCVDLSADGEDVYFSNEGTLLRLDRNLRVVNSWKTPAKKSQGTVSTPRLNQALSVLGLTEKPNNDALKLAYKKTLLRVHPDLNPQDPLADEKTRAVISAYELLTSDEFRDENRHFHDEIQIGSVNVGIGVISPPFVDWIYSTQIVRGSKSLYVGCYSGKSYIVQGNCSHTDLYDSQAPVLSIKEVGRYLYLVSNDFIDILADRRFLKRVALDERFGRFDCNDTGFIIITTRQVKLFSPEGLPIARFDFRDNIADAYMADSQLKVITAKRGYLFSLPYISRLEVSKSRLLPLEPASKARRNEE